MDPYLLAELGAVAALIPICGAVVKQTIDNFRTAFKFNSGHCVMAAYSLSFVLMFILSAATLSAAPPTFFALVTFSLKTLVGGWLAANYAGALTDSHNRAQAAVKKE